MGLVSELRRRNVLRMAVLYAVAAWLIMQVAEVVIGLANLPGWIGPAILGLLAVGFPIALIFSWFYELTPEGLSLEKDIAPGESITHVTGRRLDFLVISLLSAAVIMFAVHTWWIPEPPERSVAVLPFVPMTSGEDDGYFADGLTEEILNGLAQLPELQVTARTSSFFFKGQNIPVPEIAGLLNVAYVVEGSVRRDVERLRITAQLVRAADGFHLWSQTYDRTRDDVFAVQEDIAENIAEALHVVLDDNARQRMRNVGIPDVEAFIAYQKGLDAFQKAHDVDDYSNGLAIANVYFDRALEAVPGLAIARLMKADRAAHILNEIANGTRDEQHPGEAEEVLAAMRKEFDKAWRLSAPGNQRDILDLERTLFSEDWSGLPGRIQKAMRPGGCSEMVWAAEFIAQFGWAEQLAMKLREVLACNPMSVATHENLGYSLIWAGDPEAALQLVEEAENRGMTDRWQEETRINALLSAGHINDPTDFDPRSRVSNLRREVLAGNTALARQMAQEFWSRPNVGDRNSLVVAAWVGDRERANKLAARIDAHPGGVVTLSNIVHICYCGAPFDLKATPNYKARIEEADFFWPPAKRIDYPIKTW